MGALFWAGKPGTESRLSKVKRIITGTILLGRKGRKDSSIHSQSEDQEDREERKMKGDEQRKGGKGGGKSKSPPVAAGATAEETTMTAAEAEAAAVGIEENMDTENVPGKKVKEITIEITKSVKAAEVVLKPRKRKERLDSGGSLKQDNKVIRSNSEERAEGNDSKGRDVTAMRRVSSHEDFTRVRVLQEVNAIRHAVVDKDGGGAGGGGAAGGEGSEGPPLKEKDVTMEEIEEMEHERRRSCERFSRAVAPPRGRRALPKRKTKTSSKKRPRETATVANIAETNRPREGFLNVTDRDRSPSPAAGGVSSSPPALDITTLHKQMEGSEPITSRGKIPSPEEEPESPTIEALISPRNSLVMRLTHLDPSLPPSPPRDHNIRHTNYDLQEKKLCKQINSIKSQLKRYEEGFQEEFGYRPSHADKQANKDIKKLCSELNKCRAQLKQIKEDNGAIYGEKQLSFLTSLEGGGGGHATGTSQGAAPKHSKAGKTMEEVLQDVEKRLQEKRHMSGRSSEITEMSRGDLLEEKVAVQKALLHLENVFGRPVTREDRDLVRPLYQRYRSLKRLVVRGTGGKLNNSTGELATILEHETMEFTTSPSTSFDIGESASSAPEGLNVQALVPVAEAAKKALPEDVQNSSSSSDSIGENLHALPLSQLLEQQKNARDEKKKLRRNLREFEDSFRNETGRRAQKQDRIVIEGIYLNYKQVKAKLRLLDALIAKKSCVKRNSC